MNQNFNEQSLPSGCAYRIVKCLGSGGEGTVYLVCHLPTEQFRAAKLFTDISRDCRRELNMLKKLCHPALPKVLDVLEEPGKFWLIMEYIEGKSLDQFACRLDDEALFRVAEQLSGVLQYLHSRKEPVYHLDLKPSNILIRPDGSLVLIDFGAAIRERPDSSPFRGYGTMGFAAPEQMQERTRIDGRADIFGFGAVIYYCRFGTVRGAEAQENGGFRAKNVSLIQNTIRKTFQNKRIFPFTIWRFLNRERRRSLPPGLDKIVRKCLQREPENRFEDSGQLRKALFRAGRKFRRRKQVGQIVAAAMLLTGSLTFFQVMESAENVTVMGNAGNETVMERGTVAEDAENTEFQSEEEETDADERNQQYHLLLDMAGGLGFSQAMECFGKAALLNPGEETLYLCLLDWVQSDGLFDEEEETAVRELIFAADESGITRLEYLKENPEVYGRVAWRLGLAYWYFYGGVGGKSAASRWFEQAISALEGGNLQAEWEQDAKLHARISSYYGMLSRTDDEEEREQKEWEYWQDLKTLWNIQTGDCDNQIKRKIVEELLNRIVMDTALLESRGETKESLETVLASLEDFLTAQEQTETGVLNQSEEVNEPVVPDGTETMKETEEAKEAEPALIRLRSLCADARAAITRTFSDGS